MKKLLAAAMAATMAAGLTACSGQPPQETINAKSGNVKEDSPEKAGTDEKKESDRHNVPAKEQESSGEAVQVFQFGDKQGIRMDNGDVYEVSSLPANENGYCDIRVAVNGMECIYSDECYGADKSCLVMENGHPYILVNSHYDNDYPITCLFDAKTQPSFVTSIDAGMEDVREEDGKVVAGGFFRLDVIGSYNAYNTYTIKDGMFEVTGDVYDLCHEGQEQRMLELRDKLDVTMEDNKKETLMPGTKIYAVATDFSHTFYFLLDDGRQGYFEYEEVMEKDKDGYECITRKIEGKPEGKVFGNIEYAG